MGAQVMPKGKRILRYVGNRPEPEKSTFGTVERYIDLCRVRSEADMLFGPTSFPDVHTDWDKFPNPLFSNYQNNGGLYLPEPAPQHWFTVPQLVTTSVFAYHLKEDTERKEEPEFEVNLTEALVGWKAWHIKNRRICSRQETIWTPCEPVEAKCHPRDFDGFKQCGKPPTEIHTCGIYAADDRAAAERHGSVVGQVYGWGRYVRGEDGWRAQYAYPKSFHLRSWQELLIPVLAAYKVPIFIDQPLQVYDPKEEGYESGQNYEDGDLRATEGADSDEA